MSLRFKINGYTVLEYIQSTGTQWINTNYYPKLDATKVVADAEKDVAYSIFGSNYSDFTFTGADTHYAYYNGGSSINTNVAYTDRHLYIMDKNKVFIDSVLYGSGTLVSTTCPIPMAIFGRNIGNNTLQDGGNHKLYGLKIFENDVLIKNFIPVKRNSDNAVGLYETVGSTFYGNMGTGSFIASQTTYDGYEPDEIIYNNTSLDEVRCKIQGHTVLDYIESSATQYINTGIISDNSKTTRLEMSVSYNTTELANQIMGFTGNAGSGIGTAGAAWWEVTTPSTVTANTLYSLVWTKHGADWSRKINGTETTGSNGSTSIPSSMPMLLFAAWQSSSSAVVDYYCNCKLYEAKIYVDDILVRNYIPAMRDSDNTVGLYDTVTKTFYTNLGAGAFVASTKTYSGYKVWEYKNTSMFNFTAIDENGKLENDADYDGIPVAYAVGNPSRASNNGLNSEYFNGLNLATQYSNISDIPHLDLETIKIPSTHRGLPVVKVLSYAFRAYIPSDMATNERYLVTYLTKSFILGANIQELETNAIRYLCSLGSYADTGDRSFDFANVQKLTQGCLYGVYNIIPRHKNYPIRLPNTVTSLHANTFTDSGTAYPAISKIIISSPSIQCIKSSLSAIADVLDWLVFNNTVENVSGDLVNSAPDNTYYKNIVFKHSQNASITLSINSNKSATNCNIYTDCDAVKNYDWASKNYTVTFHPLSEYEGD